MALPASGAISLSDFNTELGITAGTAISMSDADVRALLDLASGAEASFSGYYGASSIVDIALTIAANTNNYNIFSSKGGTYSAGKSNITLTINSGVTVGSTSTGTYALETGTGWATGDTITIVNNGTVKGRGGDGGAGSTVNANNNSNIGPDSYPNGGNGNAGGNAFRAQFVTTFTNNGSVYGGGGGGGGGGGFQFASGKSAFIAGGGGGGGGAGVNAGSGGAGGGATFQNVANDFTHSGDSGSSGTSTSGGAGGYSGGGQQYQNAAGGNGGGLGSNGSNGTTIATSSTITGASPSGGSGGTRGYYQVGSTFINSGGGITGTVAGRSG